MNLSLHAFPRMQESCTQYWEAKGSKNLRREYSTETPDLGPRSIYFETHKEVKPYMNRIWGWVNVLSFVEESFSPPPTVFCIGPQTCF